MTTHLNAWQEWDLCDNTTANSLAAEVTAWTCVNSQAVSPTVWERSYIIPRVQHICLYLRQLVYPIALHCVNEAEAILSLPSITLKTTLTLYGVVAWVPSAVSPCNLSELCFWLFTPTASFSDRPVLLLKQTAAFILPFCPVFLPPLSPSDALALPKTETSSTQWCSLCWVRVEVLGD